MLLLREWNTRSVVHSELSIWDAVPLEPVTLNSEGTRIERACRPVTSVAREPNRAQHKDPRTRRAEEADAVNLKLVPPAHSAGLLLLILAAIPAVPSTSASPVAVSAIPGPSATI